MALLVTASLYLSAGFCVGCSCMYGIFVAVCCQSLLKSKTYTHTHTHNHFTALFPGTPGWASARRELLYFMVQGKIYRGRHTDHAAGHHSIQTNHCPPTPSPQGPRLNNNNNSNNNKVVNIIWEKGRIAAADGQFSRFRQVVPMYTLSNTCFFGPTQVHSPTASRSVQPFLHSSRPKVPVLYNRAPLSSLKLPLHMGFICYHQMR